MHPYVITVAPGVELYTRAESLAELRHSLVNLDPISTDDRERVIDRVNFPDLKRKPVHETIIFQWLYVRRAT